MKIRPLLLFLWYLISIHHANAQVRLGVLGGIHSANVLEKNSIPGWDATIKRFQSSISGFQLGAIVEVPLGHKGFFFQPAITYTSKGRQYNKRNDSTTSVATDTVFVKQTLNLNYIDIPLNFTYKIPLSSNHKNSFFISAGPDINFFYNGNITSQSLSRSTGKYTDETDQLSVGKGSNTYKTVDLGVNARAGFEFGNFFMNAYYSQGLTSFYNAPYQGTFHHQIIGASIGIWLTSSSTPPPTVKDTDKDGIPDDQDLCPTVPGLARYNGCPIPDSDHDGINDEEDKCPHQPGLARYQGCPIPDRDGDGVNDEEDKCPDTPGPVENRGCPVVMPEIKKEIQEKINYTAKNILFKLGSDQLTDGSHLALDDLAALLHDHPEYHLSIEGYTDNAGSPERNLLLSQKRAASVKHYLIRKGISPGKLSAKGFGQELPVADNATAAGQAANRRVELKLSIEKL